MHHPYVLLFLICCLVPSTPHTPEALKERKNFHPRPNHLFSAHKITMAAHQLVTSHRMNRGSQTHRLDQMQHAILGDDVGLHERNAIDEPLAVLAP